MTSEGLVQPEPLNVPFTAKLFYFLVFTLECKQWRVISATNQM